MYKDFDVFLEPDFGVGKIGLLKKIYYFIPYIF